MLPLLTEIKLNDVNILLTMLGEDSVQTHSYNTTIYSRLLAEMYRVMLSDKKYGLTVAVLATRVLPVLLPQLVNPQLDLEMFLAVQSTVQVLYCTVLYYTVLYCTVL